MRAQEFVQERVNPDTVKPGFTLERQLPNGFVIKAVARVPDPDDADVYFRDLQGVTITVFDPKQTNWMSEKYGIAQAKFLARQDRTTKEWVLRPVSLHVDDNYRRQGIASAMYNFVRKLGNDVVPGAAQTPMGQAFWKGGAGVGREIDFKDMPEVPPEPPKAEPAKAPEKKPSLFQRLGGMFKREPQVAEGEVAQFPSDTATARELARHWLEIFSDADRPYRNELLTGIQRELKNLGWMISSNPTQGAVLKHLATGRTIPLERISENFADGKVKGKSRPGRVKKAGASCAGSVTSLRAKARRYGGERGKMYHWCANMKGGKNESIQETELQRGTVTIRITDHAIQRTDERGIDPHAVDRVLDTLTSIKPKFQQFEPGEQFWVHSNQEDISLGFSMINPERRYLKLKTVVQGRTMGDRIPTIETK